MAEGTTSRRARRELRRLEICAHHEAGHAVAYVGSRSRFRYVTIVPNAEDLGHLRPCAPPPSLDLDAEVDPGACRWIRARLLCVMAGLAAEHRFRGRNNWRGARGDIGQALELAELLHPGDGRAQVECVMEAISRARAFVALPANWARIEAVAAALLERRTLRARTVREICGATLGGALPSAL